MDYSLFFFFKGKTQQPKVILFLFFLVYQIDELTTHPLDSTI
jgi:hypothetical protein